MKPINPRATDNPKGWLSPFTEYQKLVAKATKAGEPVHSWSIQIPDTLKEKIKGVWKLAYSINGRTSVVYIGYNSETAAEGIKLIASRYPTFPRNRKPVTEQTPKKKSPRTDALNDVVHIRKIVQQWQEGIAQLGSAPNSEVGQQWFDKNYRYHKQFMDQKAGILNMTMWEYIFKSGMYEYWPNPPMTKEGLAARLRDMEKAAQQREARNREQNDRR